MSKLTAEQFFKNDNQEAVFVFVKYLNDDSYKKSYKSPNSSYRLKCKICENEKNITRGNYAAGYSQCLFCKRNKKKTDNEIKEAGQNDCGQIEAGQNDSEVKEAGQNNCGYKIIDRNHIITIKGKVTEQVEDYFITTDPDKKELEKHLYVSADKALIINDFVFIANQESIFDKFKTISNIKIKEIEVDEDKILEDKLYEISEIRNKDVGPKDYYEQVIGYFDLDLGKDFKKDNIKLNSSCFIFNSNTKFIFTLKDSEIKMKANFCKAYLLSLILENDEEADISLLAKKDLVKLSNIVIKNGHELSPKFLDSITTKRVTNAKIVNFEKNYMFKNIIKLNKELKDSFEQSIFENNSKMLNKSETELFYIKTGIDKSFLN